MPLPAAIAIVAAVSMVILSVVWVETAVRRIPVQYVGRMVGRRPVGGSQTALPLKVDKSGVVAALYAISQMKILAALALFFSPTVWGRPGKRITLGGAVFVAAVAVLPDRLHRFLASRSSSAERPCSSSSPSRSTRWARSKAA